MATTVVAAETAIALGNLEHKHHETPGHTNQETKKEKKESEGTYIATQDTSQDNNGNVYPRYLFSSLWYVHSQTALEELVDEAILALLHLDDLWADTQFVENLYDHDTYYQNVMRIYKKINHIFWYCIPDQKEFDDEDPELGKPDPLHTKYIFYNVVKRHNFRTYYSGLVEFSHLKHTSEEHKEEPEHKEEKKDDKEQALTPRPSVFQPRSETFFKDIREESKRLMEEWKLDKSFQQIYFWSFILAVAASMKYIHLQLREQLVYVPVEATIEKNAKKEEDEDEDMASSMMHSLKKKLKRNKSMIHGEQEHHEHKSTDEYDAHLDGFVLAPANSHSISHAELQKGKGEQIKDRQVARFVKRKYLDDKNKKLPEKYFECEHCKTDHYIDPEQCYEWKYVRVCSQCLNSMQFSECVWKYVLLFEHPEYEGDLWPWYQNYAYIDDPKYAISYEEKLKVTAQIASHRITGLKFVEIIEQHHHQSASHGKATDILHRTFSSTMSHIPFMHHKHHHEVVMETISHENIRQYRKFTAKFMLGYWEIAKNIEITSLQLENISDEYNKNHKEQKIEELDFSFDDTDKVEPLIQPEYKAVWDYWMKILEETLNQFHDSDNKEFDLGYVEFKKFYHMVPSWWTFKNDQLLLELALKFKLNTEEYVKEMEGEGKETHYHNQVETAKQFRAWCQRKINVQHRLRYLLYLLVNAKIVEKSKDEKYTPHSETEIGCHGIFLYDFMKDYHIKIIQERAKHHKTAKKTLFFESAQEELAIKNMATSSSKKKKIINYEEVDLIAKYEKDNQHVEKVRDLHLELIDVLQTYDLHKFGRHICEQIITEITRKQRNSLLEVLGLVLREMPTQQSLEVLEEYGSELCHIEPENVYTLCSQVMKGTNFVAATAICLANYLQEYGKHDLARVDEWKNYSNALEKIAINKTNEIENDYLASLMLLIPTNVTSTQENIYKIVLEHRRTRFTNNERLSGVIAHMYGNLCFLNPGFSEGGDNANVLQKTNLDADAELRLLSQSPALYYYSPQGLERTEKISYIVYILYIIYIILVLPYPYQSLSISEWIMWIMNAGYVLYEALEIYESPSTYFDAINGTANFFSFLLALNWVALFLIRVSPRWFDHAWDDRLNTYQNDGDSFRLRNTAVVEVYMALFAIQSLLLMMNGLNLFRTSSFFGIFLRILTLMIQDMVRFAFLLISVFLAFYFALYIIVGQDVILTMTVTGSGPYNRFELVRGVALYMYQTLLGQEAWADLMVPNPPNNNNSNFTSGRADLAIGLIAIFSLVVIIMLLNLLVTVLTTSFEAVSEAANEEAAFTRSHRTYTLIYKTKTLTPPFNIIAYVIFAVIFTIHKIIYYLCYYCCCVCCCSVCNCCQYFNVMSLVYLFHPLAYGLFNQRQPLEFQKKHSKDRKFCRFCYYEFEDNDKLTIDNFLNAEHILEQSIDPSDRYYAKRISLYSNSYYCCYCYRPFQSLHDLLSAEIVALDIISFYVWLFVVMPFILLVIIGPAIVIRIANKIVESDDEEEEQNSHSVRRLHMHEDELIIDEIEDPQEEGEGTTTEE